jgi:hypothetical protein
MTGTDLHGQAFVEDAHTLVISPSGAILECARSLGPDQELSLKVGRREVLARVLGHAGIGESTYLYGVSFMQADAAFWGVAFPDPSNLTQRPIATLIECARCGRQLSYVLNEIEKLVLQESRSFGLQCSSCSDATLWKVAEYAPRSHGRVVSRTTTAQHSVEAASRAAVSDCNVVPLAADLPVTTAKSARKNLRKHARMRMPRAKACIQRPGVNEEIADLLNVSRSGASFRSDLFYALGAWIRIAAPCTLGGPNIFVLGRVIRTVNTDNGREYGVEYVESRP